MIHASQRLPAFVPTAIVVAGFSLIVLLIVLVVLGRAPGVETAAAPREGDPLARAVAEERWAEALDLIPRTTGSPRHALLRATCLAGLERHREAVAAFALLDLARPAPACDRTAHLHQAFSLYHQKAYAQAQDLLRHVAECYPHGATAVASHDLATRIERALIGGVSTESIRWQVQEALSAFASGDAGLAWCRCQEAEALARRHAVPPAAELEPVRLLAATILLEHDLPEEALVRLQGLDDGIDGHRCGLLRGLALISLRRTEEARRALEHVVTAGEPQVRRQAENLLQRLSTTEGTP